MPKIKPQRRWRKRKSRMAELKQKLKKLNKVADFLGPAEQSVFFLGGPKIIPSLLH
jgi:hypothetical protein